MRAVVMVDVLNVRSGPGLEYAINRQTVAGDIVEVVGFEGSVLWVQLTTGEYCAFRWNGTDYLRPC